MWLLTNVSFKDPRAAHVRFPASASRRGVKFFFGVATLQAKMGYLPGLSNLTGSNGFDRGDCGGWSPRNRSNCAPTSSSNPKRPKIIKLQPLPPPDVNRPGCWPLKKMIQQKLCKRFPDSSKQPPKAHPSSHPPPTLPSTPVESIEPPSSSESAVQSTKPAVSPESPTGSAAPIRRPSTHMRQERVANIRGNTLSELEEFFHNLGVEAQRHGYSMDWRNSSEVYPAPTSSSNPKLPKIIKLQPLPPPDVNRRGCGRLKKMIQQKLCKRFPDFSKQPPKAHPSSHTPPTLPSTPVESIEPPSSSESAVRSTKPAVSPELPTGSAARIRRPITDMHIRGNALSQVKEFLYNLGAEARRLGYSIDCRNSSGVKDATAEFIFTRPVTKEAKNPYVFDQHPNTTAVAAH